MVQNKFSANQVHMTDWYMSLGEIAHFYTQLLYPLSITLLIHYLK